MDGVRERIRELNTLQKEYKLAWFVCDDCQQLTLCDDQSPGDNWLATSKWGYERPFCDACILWCDTCATAYSRALSNYHDDCPGRACECAKCRHVGGEQSQWFVPGYAEGEGWWVTNAPLYCLRVPEECDVSTFMEEEQLSDNHKLTRWIK
jgi:hypothetical protein